MWPVSDVMIALNERQLRVTHTSFIIKQHITPCVTPDFDLVLPVQTLDSTYPSVQRGDIPRGDFRNTGDVSNVIAYLKNVLFSFQN